MVTVGELRAEVALRFERLDLPSWRDPHPAMASPREDEYTRVTDPGRFRVVHARARVWTAVLEEALGAPAATLARGPVAQHGRPGSFDRGVRLTPRGPGALPLLLLERDVPTHEGGAHLPVLDIAVARPEVVVGTQPVCGCDACDSGSTDLLEAIDATVGQVVGGPFVVLRGRTWSARWHPEGWSVGGQGRGPDGDVVADLCRSLAAGEPVRLPRHTEAFVGRSWLS